MVFYLSSTLNFGLRSDSRIYFTECTVLTCILFIVLLKSMNHPAEQVDIPDKFEDICIQEFHQDYFLDKHKSF